MATVVSSAQPLGSPASAAGKSSILGSASGLVAKHSGLALAVILILLLTVAYLYAVQKGLFGLGGGGFTGRTGAKGAADSRRGAVEDPETTSLINSINSAH